MICLLYICTFIYWIYLIMKNRLFSFINSQNITPTDFAKMVGISPATLSSIKTGRTQPTITIVEKLKQRFPDLNTDWLIFGTGEMLQSQNRTLQPAIVDSPNLFDAENLHNEEIVPKINSINRQDKQHEITNVSAIQDVSVQHSEPAKNSSKTIVKVILLYSDGSFDEFAK